VNHPDVLERRVVRQVDPVSVARVVLGLGLAVTAIAMIGLVALWLLALASGAMRSVDAFITSLGLSFNLAGLLPVLMIIGIVGSGFVTLVGALLAVLHNLLAELLGGVELVVRERRRGV
jgi:hypothetical protein